MLANVIVDGGQGTIADYPEFVRHLRALGDLRAATTPYYADGEYRDHDGLDDVDNDDGVVTAVYVNPTSGKTALVIANLNERAGTARCSVQPLGPTSARVYPRPGLTVDLAKALDLTLAPHEVLVIAIDALLAP
jgi:hypothetical protein